MNPHLPPAALPPPPPGPQAIREAFTDFTNRNWLMRVLAAGRDGAVFTQLWAALGALVADASLGLQVRGGAAITITLEVTNREN